MLSLVSVCLLELIDFYQPVCQLRSSSQGLLHRHQSRTVLALCGFKHSSVAVWNSLPVDICNCSSLSSPLPSARQHPSYGDCLEVKREYYQSCSVLDCVTQCSQLNPTHSLNHHLAHFDLG